MLSVKAVGKSWFLFFPLGIDRYFCLFCREYVCALEKWNENCLKIFCIFLLVSLGIHLHPMCDTVSRLNNCVANIDRNYSPAVLSLINMQMVWVYCEFVCLLCIVLLQGLIPEVLIKQLGSTIITTKYGKLRGPLVEFPKDAYMHFPPVEAYFGIQYASMRNNNLRFIPPSSPTERYIGIHSAWEAKPVCPQKYVRAKDLHKYLPDGSVEWITRMTSFTKDQAEDCLSLNLFVPTRGMQTFF